MKLFGWKSAGRDDARPALSRVGGLSAWSEPPRSYEAMVRAGYLDNAIAQRSVRLIADGLGEAALKGSSPELLALIHARSGGQALLSTVAAHLLLHGNAYVQILTDMDGQAVELFALRPERVTVEPDARGWPVAYRYRVGERVMRLIAEDAGGRPAVVHIKAFSPVDDHYGLGCLGAAAGPVSWRDLTSVIEVDLAHHGMTLNGADDAALDAGVNLALVGDELVQFGVTEQIGPVRWRLSRLLRGRRGTEAAIGAQAIGDRFVLIEAMTLSAIDLPLAAIGGDIQLLATGIGDGAGAVRAFAAVQGKSVCPPSPAHLCAELLPGGDTLLRWVRRSRAGWRWTDGVDAPLGEEREAYRVTIEPVGGAATTVESGVSEFTVNAAERAGRSLHIAVKQVGSFGESPPALIDLPAL